MRSTLLSLIMLLALSSSLFAKVVEKEQALSVATNFFNERVSNHQADWSSQVVNLTLETVLYTSGNEPAIYVFSNQGNGYILIAAEDNMTPVLGYSYTGTFPARGTSKNYDSFLQEYVAQVKWVREQQNYSDLEASNLWNQYISGENDFSTKATTDLAPLMTCMWNQDNPYNLMCPEDPAGPGGHVYAGCVATAMSMIMYYYRYPMVGIGTHTYYASGYGTQTVNYSATNYDWDAMTDEIGSSSGQGIPAVATLQYHAGVAVNMQYGNDGSSAYSTDVAPAMISHFNYATSSTLCNRSGYSATNWENLVVEQLDALKPLYYSGVDPTPVTGGGHAFILDGYQVTGSTKMFHFNFGWSGSANGYYTLANPNGFTTQQSLVKNMVPNTNYPYGCSARTITLPSGSFEDGSSPRINYDPNSNCTWLINPQDSVNRIYLSFVAFDVDASDALYVYDGVDENGTLLGTFTGNSLPGDLTANSGKAFIKFVTDGSIESKGWQIKFSSAFPSYCGGTQVLTDQYGTFTDGSGESRYNNNSVCRWKIQPPSALDLTLYFNSFDIAEGDELAVYSLGTSTTLLATYTGNSIPDPITSPTNSFLLMFKSNNYDQAQGFDGYYTISNVGVAETEGSMNFTLSPVPAHGYTTMNLYSKKALNGSLIINDLSGKLLYSEKLVNLQGFIDKTIDVSSLKPGIYMVTVSTEAGKATRRLMVE